MSQFCAETETPRRTFPDHAARIRRRHSSIVSPHRNTFWLGRFSGKKFSAAAVDLYIHTDPGS
jgi:hypothetical protein